jgi:uncharacterized membrane protein YsdA (DUF1294 family)/cold shock CspA family protein
MAPGRMRGTLTTWNDDRGFGFISSPETPDNVFVHISAFPNGAPRPEVGDAVSFGVTSSAKGPQASAVKLVGLLSTSRAAGVGGLDYLAIVIFVPLAVFIALHWTAPLAIFAIYVVASILCFLAYGADKRAATQGTWRTPEASLLLLGLVGGWPGAIIGMRVFRHKTRKTSFRALFWTTVVVNVIALVFVTSPLFRALLAELFGRLAA